MIIDALVDKIVVYEDRLEWYLKTSPDPIKCKVTGDKRRSHTPTFEYMELPSYANSNTGCNPSQIGKR